MQKLNRLDDVVLTSEQLAALTGISQQYLGRLRQAGVIEQLPEGHGRWALLPTVPKIIGHQRKDRRRDDSDGMAKLRAAQVQRLEIQNALKTRALIPMADAELAVDTFGAAVLFELDALPPRIARGDLAIQRRGEEEVFAARERMAARMRQVTEATRAGEDPTDVTRRVVGRARAGGGGGDEG